MYYKELKEEKWHNEKILGGYAPNLKKMANYGFLKSLWYVDPAYWSDLINAVLENKEIIKSFDNINSINDLFFLS